MQARFRRPGVCIFCSFAPRRIPVATHALSLHTSAPLWRGKLKGRSRPAAAFEPLPGLPVRRTPSHPKKRGDPPGIKRVGVVDRSNLPPTYAIKFALKALDDLRRSATKSPTIASMGVDAKEAQEHWKTFSSKMASCLRQAARGELNQEDEEVVKLVSNLQKAFKERGPKGVNLQLENAFLGHLASTISFSKDDYQNQKALADLRYPSEWYSATRKLQRKIILHVGPTNSGKTYHALKRLEEVESGTYAGPLRLLAHEVYTRMNAKGVPCALITGEERRRPGSDERPEHVACTVEMIPLHMKMDVCVIDEIQMIGDLERGWAWTQAVLGVQAKELHLCGEARTVPLIRELAASMGDEVEVNHYNRLTSLEMDDTHVGLDFKKLRKGDCIVAFSVVEIHALRQQIQKQTGKKVAIVYGSLPPETRAQQARLFNDPKSGYDVLVASDAIGMGLNLSIKRIIFASVYKFNGFEEVAISIPHLKQIAGRAGRYKTAHEANKEAEQASKTSHTANIPVTTLEDVASKNAPQDLEQGQFEFAEPKPGGGLVATIERSHMAFVRKALNAEPEAIKTAGLFPPDPIIERFANYFPPATPFSYILLRLHDISRVHTRFHMCVLKDQLTIADTIQPVDGLSVLDKVTFCAAPANIKTWTGKKVLYNLAKCVADQKNGDLLDIEGFNWSLLDRPVTADRSYLRELEELHKSLVLYLWLSYRFSGVFSTRALAFHAKTVVEEAIEATLNELTKTQMTFKKIRSRERTRVESRAEEFSEELQRAEEADKEQQKNQTEEIVVSAGSRYEEADILDGAEDGHEVEPTDVSHETMLEDVADESTEAEPAMTLRKAGPQEEEDDDNRDWTHTLNVDEGNRRMNKFVDARETDTNTPPGP